MLAWRQRPQMGVGTCDGAVDVRGKDGRARHGSGRYEPYGNLTQSALPDSTAGTV